MSLRVPNTPFEHSKLGDQGYRSPHSVDWVVIHGMEGTLDSAQSWFNNPSNPEHTCAHLLVDDKKRVQLIDLDHLCYHARGGNQRGVGIEHAAFAAWSTLRWLTHPRMLLRSANATGWICWRLGLGLPHHGPIADARTNVVAHFQLPAGGHSCPGPNFPWSVYMRLCRSKYRRLVRRHR